MEISWIPTTIEDLKPLDVVHHVNCIWVIQSIRRDYEGQIFNVTRVDDGRQSRWTFYPQSRGYLIEKRVCRD